VTTSLAPGATGEEKWEFVRAGLSAFAGRPLVLDDDVYASEAAHNRRNQAIARLLESYGRIAHDPLETTDVYTRQCSLLVSAKDLAVRTECYAADGGRAVEQLHPRPGGGHSVRPRGKPGARFHAASP